MNFSVVPRITRKLVQLCHLHSLHFQCPSPSPSLSLPLSSTHTPHLVRPTRAWRQCDWQFTICALKRIPLLLSQRVPSSLVLSHTGKVISRPLTWFQRVFLRDWLTLHVVDLLPFRLLPILPMLICKMLRNVIYTSSRLALIIMWVVLGHSCLNGELSYD